MHSFATTLFLNQCTLLVDRALGTAVADHPLFDPVLKHDYLVKFLIFDSLNSYFVKSIYWVILYDSITEFLKPKSFILYTKGFWAFLSHSLLFSRSTNP